MVDNPSVARRMSKRVNLLRDIGLIAGQLPCQVRELGADEGAEPADDREGEDDDANYRGHPAEVPAAQQQNRRPKRETQKDREGHRNKDFPPKIEACDDDDGNRQSPEAHGWSVGGTDLRPIGGDSARPAAF